LRASAYIKLQAMSLTNSQLTETEFVTEQWFRQSRIAENDSFIAVLDAYPVNDGHTLVISKRHVTDIFGLTEQEFSHLHGILRVVKERLRMEFNPTGFNVGANVGESAGQTVMHFHLHIIPRFNGDIENPRGGVRNVKPAKVPY
jgi:diadenosine tetraphosphate (Ap4A) HIT family hydrolase